MKGLLIGLLAGTTFMWLSGENFNERGVKLGLALLCIFFCGLGGFCVQQMARASRELHKLRE